jgi:hypothetical protein
MDDWIRWIFIGIIATLAATSIIYYAKSKRNSEVIKQQIVEVITVDDLDKALDQAKTKIEGAGYVIAHVTPDFINERMLDSPQLSVTLVMVDPLARNAICQRQHDEDNQPRTYGEILTKTQNFMRKSKSLLGKRLKLGFIDVYPTMTVIIIDNDLYAYFYPYKSMGRKSELGPSSPVLKYVNYTNNKQAEFFTNHLRNIFNNAKFLSIDADYQKYQIASLKDPCF